MNQYCNRGGPLETPRAYDDDGLCLVERLFQESNYCKEPFREADEHVVPSFFCSVCRPSLLLGRLMASFLCSVSISLVFIRQLFLYANQRKIKLLVSCTLEGGSSAVECRTSNRGSPGAIHLYEYMAIDGDGNLSE